MGLFNFWNKKEDSVPLSQLNEALKPFEDRLSKAAMLKVARKQSGEGIEDFSQLGSAFGVFGNTIDAKGFNTFYKKFIDTATKDAQDRILQYRSIARYPEIAEVIEDIINESTQLDNSGRIIQLSITDPELAANTEIAKKLTAEFYDMFYHRIEIQKKIDEFLYAYYVDSKLFWENIIDISDTKKGIINLKKLATETMDFSWNPWTGKMNFFVQYLKLGVRMPTTFEEAMSDSQNLITFHPKQITYLDYGLYGAGGKKDILGYLEKVKQPFNQLKLIETSIVIYRLIRAPERLVFKVDTGNMPPDRAMRFVANVQRNLQKKVFYDPSDGKLSNQPNVMCLSLNTEIIVNETPDTLRNIIERFASEEELYTISVDEETGEQIVGHVIGAGITRRNAEVIEVELSNGLKEVVTPDHKFILANGDVKDAEFLSCEDDLMPYNGVSVRIVSVKKLEQHEDTGCITVYTPSRNHNFLLKSGVYVRNSILDNYFLPQSASGRGSSVESVGGNPSGFSELDDLHYFQKKLYRALKYPMSRVEHIFEQQAKEIRVADSSGEIARDETKWGRFLKKHQDKFSEAFLDVFMLDLEFKGWAEEFGIKRDMLHVSMTVPNDFIGSMKQVEFDRKWNNYQLSDHPEFSKYWRMKRILKLTDEEIQENVEMLKKDKELGLTPSEDNTGY